MALYVALARVGYRRYAAYPGATAAGLFTKARAALVDLAIDEPDIEDVVRRIYLDRSVVT